jgi:uncharacterized protein
MNFFQFLLGATCMWAAVSTAVAAAPAPVLPYTLDNTEVIDTPSARLNRRYEAYISLPADYAKSSRRYPVLYVTDAPYAFPLIRAIAGRVDRHGAGLEPFILVGLSYAKGESGVVSRNRDYTPTDRSKDRKTAPGQYGQSGEYLDFLVKEVIPQIDSRYRTEPGRRIFVGHSYGSLLGLRALLEQPKVFSHFILGSPSLWFDKGQPFVALKEYSQTQPGLHSKLRFYVGGLERPSKSRPNDENMVALMNQYVAALRANKWRGLDVQSMVLEGEDHATVFPRLITHGLLWALPKPQ